MRRPLVNLVSASVRVIRDGVVRIAARGYNPQDGGPELVLALAATSLARPGAGAERATHRQRLHRDHPVRSHEVRGRQGVRLPARRPSAAHLLAAALTVWLHSTDLLWRAGAAARRRLRAR